MIKQHLPIVAWALCLSTFWLAAILVVIKFVSSVKSDRLIGRIVYTAPTDPKTLNEISNELAGVNCFELGKQSTKIELDASTITHCTKGADKEWLERANFAPSDHSAYRGRYLHHYSTVIFPFLMMKQGDWQSVFNAHYGAVSIIPLFLLDFTGLKISFELYNISSYLIALCVSCAVLFVFEKQKCDLLRILV